MAELNIPIVTQSEIHPHAVINRIGADYPLAIRDRFCHKPYYWGNNCRLLKCTDKEVSTAMGRIQLSLDERLEFWQGFHYGVETDLMPNTPQTDATLKMVQRKYIQPETHKN